MLHSVRERLSSPQFRRVVVRTIAFAGVVLVLGSFASLAASLLPWLRTVDWRALSLDWRYVAAAVGVFTLCPILRGVMWWCLLSGFGSETALMTCLYIQARANLVKYVPGGIWEMAGKTFLSRRSGPAGITAGVAAAVDLGCVLATGVIVALALVPWAHPEAKLPAAARGLTMAFLAAGLYAAPRALNHIASKSSIHGFLRDMGRMHPTWWHLSILVMLAHWITAGLGISLLVTAYEVSQPVDLLFATYSLALSATIGLVVVIAPAGIGVREAMMTRILEQRLPLGPASFVAILSRVGLVAGELVAFIVLFVITRAWRAPRTPINEPSQP